VGRIFFSPYPLHHLRGNSLKLSVDLLQFHEVFSAPLDGTFSRSNSIHKSNVATIKERTGVTSLGPPGIKDQKVCYLH